MADKAFEIDPGQMGMGRFDWHPGKVRSRKLDPAHWLTGGGQWL
jgi:hypothetical protein